MERLFLFACFLFLIFFFIPLSEISKNIFFSLRPRFCRILDLIITTQIIAFLPEHDLCDPFSPLPTEINPFHTTGIGLICHFRTQHFQTGTVCVMEILPRISQTAALRMRWSVGSRTVSLPIRRPVRSLPLIPAPPKKQMHPYFLFRSMPDVLPDAKPDGKHPFPDREQRHPDP